MSLTAEDEGVTVLQPFLPDSGAKCCLRVTSNSPRLAISPDQVIILVWAAPSL